MTLHILSVWVHILAATVWIGGMVFLSLVLVPALRRMDNAAVREDLLRLVARRFRPVAWTSIVLLLGTGFANLMWGGQWPNFETSYGRLLGIKLILVGLMVLLTILHDVSAGIGTSVRVTRWAPRAALVVGLAVLLFAVSLARV